MEDILNAPFVQEMCETAENMYRLGWGERNSGNISYLLDEEQVARYLDINKVIRKIPLMGVNATEFDVTPLIGKNFIITGTGSYFKNIKANPENNLGIVRVADNGDGLELLWGYKGGGRTTSEIPTHLMCHIERLKADPENRVVMHAHPTNLLAMTYVHELDTAKFTHTLWQMSTESIIIFPDGVEVLPWMVCGTRDIGIATAQKMKSSRIVVWAMHGIYGTGKTMDETFGLIETAEKAAQIYMLTSHLPRVNTITDSQLRELANLFKAEVREGILSD